jgi:hypothetical protein
MARKEFILGNIKFCGEPQGEHVHVSVLGAGPVGHRPLCGMLRFTEEEWTLLEKTASVFLTLRSTLGDWDYAGLAEDAEGTDYAHALRAVARLEAAFKELVGQ